MTHALSEREKQVEEGRERETHSLQGSDSGRSKGMKARPLLQRQEDSSDLSTGIKIQ